MSEEEHKDSLDIKLRRTINTSPPQFDAEAWQRKYHREFSTLLSRAHEAKVVRPGPASWLGLAAAIAVVGYGLLCWTGLYRTHLPPPNPAAEPAARLTTMSSLLSAFRRGGMEELNTQLDKAVEQLGPRPTRTSTAGLLTDLES
jgi:hypothetical protein